MYPTLSTTVLVASALAFSLSAVNPVFAQDNGGSKPGSQDAIQYVGRAFVFEADYDYARSAGWVEPGATDADIQERLRAALKTRVRRTGRFVEAQVVADADGRLAVVFVGRQDPRIETFLADGLSHGGRLSYHVVAVDADLGVGATLTQERERLRVWKAANPGKALAFFRVQPRAEGGPHAAIEWMLADGSDELATAMPLLRGSVFALGGKTAPLQRVFAVDATESDGKELSLRFELKDETSAALEAFGSANAERRCVAVLDDRVVDAREDSKTLFAQPYIVYTRWESESSGSKLLAISGGPIAAPLSFVEFSKRELQNVKRR